MNGALCRRDKKKIKSPAVTRDESFNRMGLNYVLHIMNVLYQTAAIFRDKALSC